MNLSFLIFFTHCIIWYNFSRL